MIFTYRPLPEIWPTGERTRYPGRSRFKANYAKTMALLNRELAQLGVGHYDTVVIEAGYTESDIRNDGQPRANARPKDPAIVVNFKSKFGHLRYGCDAFNDHLDNLYAITLALEHLRAVDRYGVTKRGEQYAGWKALPAAGEATSSQEAELLLRQFSPPGATLLEAYRAAAKKLHPDVGGSREEWAALQRAKEALRL